MGDSSKMMKDISLNEPVSVTVPAHFWAGFLSAYASTKWESADADQIASAAIDALYDPEFLKERQAEHSAHHTQRAAMMRMLTGQSPDDDTPPGERSNLGHYL